MTTQRINPAMPEPKQPNDEPAMSLIEHLVELRVRLVRASIGVLIGMGVGLFLVLGPPQIIDIIIERFANTNQEFPPVQAVETFEQFNSYITVALTVGIIIGMPVIVYQLLAFIIPGLTDRERRVVFSALPFVMFFFIAGLAFGWFITVPVAIRFLVDFSSSELIQAQPTISDFLGKITMLLLINGIVFELPVIIFVLAFLGVVTAVQLRTYRRFAVVAVVIIAALITPTGDPINLALLAIPMYLLYEVGVFMARFAPKRT